MKSPLIAIALLAVAAIPAAAQMAPAAAPKGACERGASRMQIGGLDLDAARCQLLLMEQDMGKLLAATDGSRAELLLKEADLAAAQAAAAKREKEWAEYAKPLYEAPTAPESK